MHGSKFWPFIIFLEMVICGCGDSSRSAPTTIPSRQEITVPHFDPTTASTIGGRVLWEGEPPTVPAFRNLSNLPQGETSRQNPNAPTIDPKTQAIANAVVFLRGVDLAKSRPWDHPSVRVEQRGRRFHVVQGTRDATIGFVRRGEPVQIVSKDDVFHSLHAGEAAFFTLAFPDPEQPLSRRLERNGVVELTSAAGYYWMRAYLFVDEHPYYTLTDQEGCFQLLQVPPGEYEVVCWLPNWIESRHERHPEIGVIWRLFFRPAVERTVPQKIRIQEVREVGFSFSIKVFE